MQSTTEAASGSAQRWGPLWGARPADWALNEEQQIPSYEEALRHVQLEPGQLVLDVGCGVGTFLRLVASRGARAFGIDASEALLALARERVPGADLRVGDMEALPWDDDTFDLVTGFSAFFFANDFVAAVREAGRVAKPGAPVVIQVWGPHEHNELEAMKAIARPYLPPRPADAPTFDSVWSYEYDDEHMLRRALLAPAGLAAIVGPEREGELGDAIVAGMAPYRDADGRYRLRSEFHFLIARA
jgi:SAM-dependent methyltransferase